MLHQRERRTAPVLVPIRAVAPGRANILPPPAPLPNLRDALARRAALYGPQQLDADSFLVPALPDRPWFWRSLGDAARDALASLADVLSGGA